MCGIYAVYNPLGVSQDLTGHLRALRTLAHRGPDDEGTYLDDTVFVGHRRLSILDLSPAGHQPMLGANGRVVLAFNGQIYNHPELRVELEAKGYRFRSTSDTETLLNMYLEYGLDAFPRLRGMWAVVIWDRRDDSLVASRDRLGIKPLYLYRQGGELVLASEIKAIVHGYPGARRMDDLSLRRYVTRGWLDHTTRTMFAGVEAIDPASVVVWRNGQEVLRRRFWELPRPRRERRDVAELRNVFVDAVRRHLQSDVPVAVALSGGLDSTSITCALARALGMGDRVHAFTVRPPDTPDESPWVDDTVRWTGIRHAYLDLGELDVVKAFDDLLVQMDEPVFNSAYVYQALLRRQMGERGYKVLLVGDGGDEVFAGYAKIVPMFVTSLLRDGNSLAARRAVRGAVELTGRGPAEQIPRLRLYRERGIGARTVQEFRRGYDLFAAGVDLDDDVLFPEVAYPQLEDLGRGVPFFRELLDRLRIDIPHHLRNEDRNSMGHGVEARPVFVDHALLEFAWTYPYEMFMADGVNKRLMRDAMKGTVPPSVLELKQKFARPGNNTVLAYDTLKEPLREILNSAAVRGDGLWCDDIADLYERDSAARDPDNAYPWFRFYMAQRWAELKLGSRSEAEPAAA